MLFFIFRAIIGGIFIWRLMRIKSNKRKETMNIRLNAKLKKNLKRVITLVLAIAMIFTQNNIPGLNINMFPSASDGNVVTVNLHGYSGDENGKKIVINFTAAKSETISSTDTSTEPRLLSLYKWNKLHCCNDSKFFK